jgi:hypothetical protein
LVGRFRIEAQLGSGGMGAVYRAHDPVLDRAVALKVLHTDPDGDDGDGDGAQRLRRVVREARAAAALTHPNTVTIFEVGEAENEVFIAMELLEGEDLRAILERGDASIEDKLRWLLQTARALQAAHERGLVHRDVKPENMFVCKDGTLKLLDFGIAKRDHDEVIAQPALDAAPSSLRTEAGRAFGTPRYMSPEQRAGEPTDVRTDQYAWGLVAFELLTGTVDLTGQAEETATRPADVASAAPVLSAARIDELRDRAPRLADATVLALARTLAPDKADRFPSMKPLIAALEATGESAAPLPLPFAKKEQTIAPRPARTGRWYLTAAALVVASGALVALIRRETATRGTRDEATSGAIAPLPACRVESIHAVAAADGDRVTVLPDGTVVIARDLRHRFELERETADAGLVPMLRTPLTAAIGGNYTFIELGGAVRDHQPAVLVLAGQGPGRGGFIASWSEKGGMGTSRVEGALLGLAAASDGEDIFAIATTEEFTMSKEPFAAEVDSYRMTPTGLDRRAAVEVIAAQGPAVAASADRIAVSYSVIVPAELHFAFLDKEVNRVGDVFVVAKGDMQPAVAFAGEAAAVFWFGETGRASRLDVATITPGDAAFTPPRMAVDDPLAPVVPVTARLPTGSWVVAWVASRGGPNAVRISPIGPHGALTGPTDIAKATTVTELRAAATDTGVTLWWRETDKIVRVARVACNAQRETR